MMLQQYLPLAVLKLEATCFVTFSVFMLQQYLPLAVLKQREIIASNLPRFDTVATVLTACGIETDDHGN